MTDQIERVARAISEAALKQRVSFEAWGAVQGVVPPLDMAAIARAAIAAASEWLPIESAPMDGTPIMLFARAKTATASIRVVGWYLEDMGWIEASFTRPVGLVPSAWQPLPQPPKVTP